MTIDAALPICIAAAFVASAINAAAGGGTFLTFPLLTGVAGLTEKAANITSTIALWPGAATSALAARADYASISKGRLISYAFISIIGAALGAVLLRVTSPESFKVGIPWLLLLATVTFAFGKRIAAAARKFVGPGRGMPIFAGLLQFAIAIYGGFFGAGIGVLMLAGLAIGGMEELRAANALENLLGTVINAVAVTVFLTSPDARWSLILPMALAAVAGGCLGVRLTRKIPQPALRILVIAIGSVLTLFYFYKAFAASAPFPNPISCLLP